MITAIDRITPITRESDAAGVATATYDDMIAALTALTPAQWSAQTECPGWTVTDQVRHVLTTEQMMQGAPVPDVDVSAHAHVRHREAARRTLQQAHAQVGFQLADAPAQARLGNAERAFRCGETTMVHDGGEVIEIVEILHADNSVFGTYSGI